GVWSRKPRGVALKNCTMNDDLEMLRTRCSLRTPFFRLLLYVFVAGWGLSGAAQPGIPLWTNYYRGYLNRSDEPLGLAVDGGRNVYVAGVSRTPDGRSEFATIAYDPAGGSLWTNRYSEIGDTDDYPIAGSVADRGYVYVGGYTGSNPGSFDYTVIAYS